MILWLCCARVSRLANVAVAARAIQDLLLKDFKAKSEFSDWFARQDEPPSSAKPARKVLILPNPINVEHEEKIVALEARIKRLVPPSVHSRRHGFANTLPPD